MNLKYAKRSEDTEQIKVINWANCSIAKYQDLRWIFHPANGGSRNKAEAVKLKQMGVKPGVSDLNLPFPRGAYIGLYIEMKYGKNYPTKEQIEFLTAMQEVGHLSIICYSADAAIEVLERYLNLKAGELFDMDNLRCKSKKIDKYGLMRLE